MDHTANRYTDKEVTATSSTNATGDNAAGSGAEQDSRPICHRCTLDVKDWKDLKRHYDEQCEPVRIYECLYCTFTTPRRYVANNHRRTCPQVPSTGPCPTVARRAGFKTTTLEAHYALACCGHCYYRKLSSFLKHWQRHEFSELPEDYYLNRLKGLLDQPRLKPFLESHLIPQLGSAEGLTRFLRWCLEPEQSYFLAGQRVAESPVYEQDNVKTAMIIRVLEGCPAQQSPDEHASDAIQSLGQLLPKFKSTAPTMSAAHTISQRILNEIGQLQQLVSQMDGVTRTTRITTHTSSSQRSVYEHVAMDGLLVKLQNEIEGLRTLLLGKYQLSYHTDNNGQEGTETAPLCPPFPPHEIEQTWQSTSTMMRNNDYMGQQQGEFDGPLDDGMEDDRPPIPQQSETYGSDRSQPGANVPSSSSGAEISGRDHRNSQLLPRHTQGHTFDQLPPTSDRNHPLPWNGLSLQNVPGRSELGASEFSGHPRLRVSSNGPREEDAFQRPTYEGDPFWTNSQADILGSPHPEWKGAPDELERDEEQDTNLYRFDSQNDTSDQFQMDHSFFLRNERSETFGDVEGGYEDPSHVFGE